MNGVVFFQVAGALTGLLMTALAAYWHSPMGFVFLAFSGGMVWWYFARMKELKRRGALPDDPGMGG